MTEIDDLKKIMAAAWSGKTHVAPLAGAFEAPETVRPGGLTDTLITVTATAAQEHYAARLDRLSHAVHKLAGWSGNDISGLIEQGYLEEGDLA